MTACKRHSESPVKGYNQCAGCEIEALRAENGRLTKDCSAEMFLTMTCEVTRLRTELEAARGLLRHASSVLGSQGWDVLTHEIDTLLTATPAPEVRCQTCDGTGDVHRADGEWLGECQCAKAEQGERQEAQVMARVHHNPDHPEPVRAVLNSIGRQLPDNAPLYAEPQQGPDVRGLLEAAQHADDVLSTIVRNDQPIETLKRQYGEDWSCAIDAVRASLVTQITAHRQAQRKGESHDT